MWCKAHPEDRRFLERRLLGKVVNGVHPGAPSALAGLMVVVDHVGLISSVKAHASIDGIVRIGYVSYLCVK